MPPPQPPPPPPPPPPQTHHGDIQQVSIATPHRSSGNESDSESCIIIPNEQKLNKSPSRCSSSSSSSSTTSCYLSECSVEDCEVETESGKVGVVNLSKADRDCRICHLSLDGSDPENGLGLGIELGCCCKEDLAAAHRHCAETWFKIRGNKTCEICGSIARNVVGVNEVELIEQWNDATNSPPTAAVPPHVSNTRRFWQGHRFLNFLLACMVFAFVISWLFHFNVPS